MFRSFLNPRSFVVSMFVVVSCIFLMSTGVVVGESPRPRGEKKREGTAGISETFVAPVRYDYGKDEYRKDYTPRMVSRLEVVTKDNQSAFALRVGQSWRVVLNGRISRPHDYLGLKIPGTPAYRRPYWPWLVMSGGRAAYCAQIEGKWYVVVDGRESRAYDGVDCTSIQFAPNGRGPAFFARKGKKSFLVMAGREYPGYDNAHDFRFSEDGRHFVYFARRGHRTQVIYDGREVAGYDGVKSVETLTRGAHIAYVLRTMKSRRKTFLGARARVFKDALEVANFEHVEQPVLSSSGNLAFFARKWGRRMGMLARGGKVNAWNHELGYASDIVFSRDGSNMAYRVVWDAGFETMMISGSRVARFARVSYPVGGGIFATKGNGSIYIASKGRKIFVVVNGAPGKLYDEVRNSINEGHPAFDPTGRRFAYQARLGDKWLTVVDGRESSLYTRVGPVSFAVSGKSYAYMAREKNKSFIVLNGRRGPAYDSIQSCGFDKQGDFHYVARAGRKGIIVANERRQEYDYIVRGCPSGNARGTRGHIGVARSKNGDTREFVVIEKNGRVLKYVGPGDPRIKTERPPTRYFNRIEFLNVRAGKPYFIGRVGPSRYAVLGEIFTNSYDAVLNRRIYFSSNGGFYFHVLRDRKLFVVRGAGTVKLRTNHGVQKIAIRR